MILKISKKYISLCDCNPDRKSRNKRREPCSRILEKGEESKKEFIKKTKLK